MIKTTLIYFILDKCLDKLEYHIELNMLQPELRKAIIDLNIWDNTSVENLIDKIKHLSKQLQYMNDDNMKDDNDMMISNAAFDELIFDKYYPPLPLSYPYNQHTNTFTKENTK